MLDHKLEIYPRRFHENKAVFYPKEALIEAASMVYSVELMKLEYFVHVVSYSGCISLHYVVYWTEEHYALQCY